MKRESIAGLWRSALPMPSEVNSQWRCRFRDNAIEEIKRVDALLEYAAERNDTAEAEHLRT